MAHITRLIADRKGDSVALVDDVGSETWTELDQRVNRVINALRSAGLTEGDTVALMCGNSREFFEVTVAGMHAGWVVVPVNWHWVADELAYVIDDSDASAAIIDGRFAAVAAAAFADARTGRCRTRIMTGTSACGFENYETVLAGSAASEPEKQCSGGPMFYTSGTTGFPKGVRSILSKVGLDPALVELAAQGATAVLGLPTDGVTLLEGPAYHSAQWAFAVFPLLGGASTLVMRHKFDAAELLVLIDKYHVTNVHLVPAQFNRLLKLSDDVRASFDGGSLVTAIHGAAPCPADVKRKMLTWWGPVVSEYYGGTEAGFLTLISGEDWLAKPGSVGPATAMTELMIVGEDGHDCEPNESGQIYFSSRTGADFAYHKAPEKTRAAHLRPGVATLGDVGYLDADGYLFMSDRKIDMIISGGVNIYPAEIEAVLVGHPSVADAAVFGIPDDEMGEEVKAAVELVEGLSPSDELASELLLYVQEHLAGYKAPRSIDFETKLPRQPSGKLYKRLLRDPYWAGTGRTI